MDTYPNNYYDHVPLNDGYSNSRVHDRHTYNNPYESNEVGGLQEPAKLPASPGSLILFGGGILLMFGSLVAFCNEAGQGLIVDCLQLVFLLLIGFIVAIVDAPSPLDNHPFVKATRENFIKYCGVVVPVTGKGLTLSFAGSALWCSLFTNVTSVATHFFVGTFSMIAFLIGLGTVVYGMIKSVFLHSAKVRFNKTNTPLSTYWPTYAHDDFIEKPGFNRLLYESAEIQFGDHDLTLIFRALSSKGNSRIISKNDVEQWLGSTFTML